MSKQAKIIIFSVILFASFLLKHCSDYNVKNKQIDPLIITDEDIDAYNKQKSKKPSSFDFEAGLPDKIKYPQPENGFSPYNAYFGQGIYNNSTQNSFIIKNDNSTDAVVLLVDAYSNRKIRNEYIRKGNTFTMTGVPNGTYYLRWISGNDWSPNLQVGNLRGGFQSRQSFSETESSKDWMRSDGGSQWTVTLYSVVGGTVGVDNLNENEFAN
jgi:hypothetical protein